MKCKDLEELKRVLKERQGTENFIMDKRNEYITLMYVWYNPKLSRSEVRNIIIKKCVYYGDESKPGSGNVTLLFPQADNFTFDLKSMEELKDVILDSANWEKETYTETSWGSHAPKVQGTKIESLDEYIEYLEVHRKELGEETRRIEQAKELELEAKRRRIEAQEAKKYTGPVRDLETLCMKLENSLLVEEEKIGHFCFYNKDVNCSRGISERTDLWYEYQSKTNKERRIIIFLPPAGNDVNKKIATEHDVRKAILDDKCWVMGQEKLYSALDSERAMINLYDADAQLKRMDPLDKYVRYLYEKDIIGEHVTECYEGPITDLDTLCMRLENWFNREKSGEFCCYVGYSVKLASKSILIPGWENFTRYLKSEHLWYRYVSKANKARSIVLVVPKLRFVNPDLIGEGPRTIKQLFTEERFWNYVRDYSDKVASLNADNEFTSPDEYVGYLFSDQAKAEMEAEKREKERQEAEKKEAEKRELQRKDAMEDDYDYTGPITGLESLCMELDDDYGSYDSGIMYYYNVCITGRKNKLSKYNKWYSFTSKINPGRRIVVLLPEDRDVRRDVKTKKDVMRAVLDPEKWVPCVEGVAIDVDGRDEMENLSGYLKYLIGEGRVEEKGETPEKKELEPDDSMEDDYDYTGKIKDLETLCMELDDDFAPTESGKKYYYNWRMTPRKTAPRTMNQLYEYNTYYLYRSKRNPRRLIYLLFSTSYELDKRIKTRNNVIRTVLNADNWVMYRKQSNIEDGSMILRRLESYINYLKDRGRI